MPINFTNVVDLNNNRIQNVGAPAQSSDAVTKQYVDNVATGLTWKNAVRVAATSNISISAPGTTIDSITLATGNRILLMGQTNGAQNGIWVFNGAASALTRATDADQDAEVGPGTAVTVSEGTTNGNKTFVLITPAPITVGTTSLNWALLNAGTSPLYTAGNGIDITNHVVTAVAAANSGISVSGAGIGTIADPAGGLTVGANGVAAKLAASSGLSVDSSGLKFVPKTNAGLAVDASGASVLAGQGIATDSNGVKAVADPAGGLQVGSAGVAAKLASPSGLTVGSGGLAAVAAPNGGVTVGASGISVNVDANGGLVASASGLGVKPSSGKGITVDSNGISATLDANGGVIVGSAGLAVKAGQGIVVDSTGVHIDTTVLPRKYSATIGDGSSTDIVVTHSLNTKDVQVQVYATSAPYDTVYAEVARTDANTVTVSFGSAPTSGQYRAVVIG